MVKIPFNCISIIINKITGAIFMNNEIKNKNKRISFLKEQTNMPPIALADLSFIEITGKNYVEIDGIKKILECNREKIIIRFKDNTVDFSGKELIIRNFNEKSAIIEGSISSIVFE